jgi:hypothetical protein
MRSQPAQIGGRLLPISLHPFAYLFPIVCFTAGASTVQALVPPAATTTTLAVSTGRNAVITVTSGSVVTLTATVSAGATPLALEQINFRDATAKTCTDIHLLGTDRLSSIGTARLKFPPGIGSHSYHAVFVGSNSDNASSSTPPALTVTTAATNPTMTTIVTQSIDSNHFLTATLFGIGGVSPTGMVSFLDASNANAVLATEAFVPGTAGFSSADYSIPLGDSQLPDRGNTLVATGDFNGDGIPDLATLGVGGSGSQLSILLGNGDGLFTPAAGSPARGVFPVSITLGYVNRDGVKDLAVANRTSNSVTILLGKGDGTFSATPGPATGTHPESVAAGGFNGDGTADLTVANLSNAVTILSDNGDGSFAASTSPAAGSG